jgi:hypothetical protein
VAQGMMWDTYYRANLHLVAGCRLLCLKLLGSFAYACR